MDLDQGLFVARYFTSFLGLVSRFSDQAILFFLPSVLLEGPENAINEARAKRKRKGYNVPWKRTAW